MTYKKFYSALSFAAFLSLGAVADDTMTMDVVVDDMAMMEGGQMDCDLAKFKMDLAAMKGIQVSDDPAGVAFESAKDLAPTLMDYTMKHQCRLYAIDLQKLINGLLKGNGLPEMQKQPKSDEHKYIAMEGKKARCAATLGLKLPITAYGDKK